MKSLLLTIVLFISIYSIHSADILKAEQEKRSESKIIKSITDNKVKKSGKRNKGHGTGTIGTININKTIIEEKGIHSGKDGKNYNVTDIEIDDILDSLSNNPHNHDGHAPYDNDDLTIDIDEHRPGHHEHGHGLGHGLGHEPGHGPGHGLGHEPGHGPGHEPGHGLGHEPGHGPGHEPGHGPGHEPGHGLGHEPGHGPGHGLGHEPGHGHGPGHGLGHGHGHDNDDEVIITSDVRFIDLPGDISKFLLNGSRSIVFIESDVTVKAKQMVG